MTTELKNVMRDQFVEFKTNMTEEQEHELYISEQYNLTTDELVAQLTATYDELDFFEGEYAEAALSEFDQTIESIIMTRELEEEIFEVDQHVLDYLDRLVEALKIVKQHYASKVAVCC